MPSQPLRRNDPVRKAARIAALAVAALVPAACGRTVLTDGRALSRGGDLAQSSGAGAERRLFIDRAAMVGVRTVRIVPTAFPASVSGPGLSEAERRLVANAADRALCYELSLRYAVVATPAADLTVRASVTHVDLTNAPVAGTTAGAATALSLATHLGIATSHLAHVGKVPIPRLPIGLGSLTVEAEALGADDRQSAAMIWGGAANAVTSQARFSSASDAYDLAREFGQDFGRFLATGIDPAKAPRTFPTLDRIRVTTLGELPRDPGCAAFGRTPGLDGILGDSVGLPPDWTDRGAGRPAN